MNNTSNVSFQGIHHIISGRKGIASETLQITQDLMKESNVPAKARREIAAKLITLHQLTNLESQALKKAIQPAVEAGDVFLLKNKAGETFLLDNEESFLAKALLEPKKALKYFEQWKENRLECRPKGRDYSQQEENAKYFDSVAERIKTAVLEGDKDSVLKELPAAVQYRTVMENGDSYTREYNTVGLLSSGRRIKGSDQYEQKFNVINRKYYS